MWLHGFAQDTTYFDSEEKQSGTVEAVYYSIIYKGEEGQAIERQYYINDVKKSYTMYADLDSGLITGEKLIWDNTGKLVSSTSYFNGILHGSSIEYYSSGNYKSEKIFEDGQHISSAFYKDQVFEKSPLAKPKEKNETAIVEDLPYLKSCLEYSSKLQKMECTEEGVFRYFLKKSVVPNSMKEGKYPFNSITLYLRYLINEEGLLVNPTIVRPKNPPQEFIDLVFKITDGFPQMTPGTQNGEPVRVQYTIPVKYKVEW